MVGYTLWVFANQSKIILFPADPDCNSEKVFVIISATDDNYFL
jgi:hypothetical protein